ncbi:MAG TPA: cysteine desulfurase family protein [Bacilli bacterium]|nr:cysteine desulfurase family protein [Bacilli bacterium]HQC83317.1 cysteine desulfurase family protein [Bacilli bacterium]
MVYLDYSATTPVLPEVLDSYNKVTEEYFANSSSLHSLGIKSNELLKSATKQIAELLSIKEEEFTFVSGATEANNMALLGVAETYKRYGNHIAISTMEHPSMYGICKHLEKLGFIIDYINVTNEGVIDFDDLKNKVTKDTILVSISAVNSETGARQPLKTIRQVIHKNNENVIFHSDMTQAIGKVPIIIDDVDLASISGEKIYGPAGIGLLYHTKGLVLVPLMYGAHEGELRPGTMPLPLIVSFAKALRLSLKDLAKKEDTVRKYRDKIIAHLADYPDVYINSSKYCIPHILNISIMGIKPETFIHALETDEVYVSSNTACTSGKPSPAIMAMYNDQERSKTTIRISLSYLTLPSEIGLFLDSFDKHYEELKRLK